MSLERHVCALHVVGVLRDWPCTRGFNRRVEEPACRQTGAHVCYKAEGFSMQTFTLIHIGVYSGNGTLQVWKKGDTEGQTLPLANKSICIT